MHYMKAVKFIRSNKFRRVLVTGPARSGTTITAKILAHELNFTYVDEKRIKWDNFDKLFTLYTTEKDFVLQAPAISAYCHMMPGVVVFMRRPTEEIMKSEKRIGFTPKNNLLGLKKYFRDTGFISEVKYEIWDKWQKNRPNMLEVDYNSIKDHSFYLPDNVRKSFKPKQTEI